MSCGGGTDMQSGGARKKAKSSTKKTTNKLKELEFLEFQKGSNKPKRVMVDKKDVKAEKGTKKNGVAWHRLVAKAKDGKKVFKFCDKDTYNKYK